MIQPSAGIWKNILIHVIYYLNYKLTSKVGTVEVIYSHLRLYISIQAVPEGVKLGKKNPSSIKYVII